MGRGGEDKRLANRRLQMAAATTARVMLRYWLYCAIDCDWTVEHFQVFCCHCFTCAINFALCLIYRSIYVALDLFAYSICHAFLDFYRHLMFVVDCAFVFTEDHIFTWLIYLHLGLYCVFMLLRYWLDYAIDCNWTVDIFMYFVIFTMKFIKHRL